MQNQYPDNYICPITLNLMLEPVKASDNKIYDKNAIEDWLSRSKISPLTNQEISDILIVDIELKEEINNFIKKNKIYVEEYTKEANNQESPRRPNVNYLLATFVEGSTSLVYFDCFNCNEPLLIYRMRNNVTCQCGQQYLLKECSTCNHEFVIKSGIRRCFKCDNCKISNRICENCIIC